MSPPRADRILTPAELASHEAQTAAIGELAELLVALAAEPIGPLRDDEPAPLFLTEEHP